MKKETLDNLHMGCKISFHFLAFPVAISACRLACCLCAHLTVQKWNILDAEMLLVKVSAGLNGWFPLGNHKNSLHQQR